MTISDVSKDVDQIEFTYIAGRSVKFTVSGEVAISDSQTDYLPYDPEVLLLGIYPRGVKTGSQGKTCIRMFKVIFTHMGLELGRTKSSSTEKLINEVGYIHTMDHDLATQRNEPWIYVTT